MFERRLRGFLFLLLIVAAVLMARLADLQVLRADHFRKQAADAELRDAQSLPFVRGNILDRTGRVLARDEPSWELRLDYAVLPPGDGDLDPTVIDGPWATLVRRCLEQNRYEDCASTDEVDFALRGELNRMWNELAEFASLPRSELERRAYNKRQRVLRQQSVVEKAHGYAVPLAEQIRPGSREHAILTGLDNQQQIDARRAFADYPWVSVKGETRRVYPGGESVVHIAGRMGAVSAETLENDPNKTDALGRYLRTDRWGVRGVERAAEDQLRGRRGSLQLDRKGEIIKEISPERGRDVTLTLRLDLQQRLYSEFGSMLQPPSVSGAIVVLHVPTREVLALVSYPGYAPERFSVDYEDLVSETVNLPLHFRAVGHQFAPGSIVKPLTCLAGLSGGVITPETRFTCIGRLFADLPDRWRCWGISGTNRRKAHGSVNVVEALAGSCNVFHYQVGEAVGFNSLMQFFEMAGFGRPTGIGLGEKWGVNPSPGDLIRRGIPVTPGKARHLAIGQGELSITPVQAANLVAVYASGSHRPVTLIRSEPPTPVLELPVADEHWRVVREGLYRVVNTREGTAYDYARLDDSLGYALCGKTGSAETPRLHTSYIVNWVNPDGVAQQTSVPAGSKRQAQDDFERANPGIDVTLDDIDDEGFWPPEVRKDGKLYTHAWFVGYLQPLGAQVGRAVPDGAGVGPSPTYELDRQPPIAFSVLVEFGGSGSRTAAPIGKRVAETILAILGPDLDPDFPESATHPVIRRVTER